MTRGISYGRVATISSGNAVVRLMREDGQAVVIQVCRSSKCIEASVNPRNLYHALYALAADTLGENVVDILERAKEALWAQIIADRAAFTIALQKRGKDSDDARLAAARLMRDWETLKMLEDIIAMVAERKTRDICSNGDCVKAALEICNMIDEIAGNASILRQIVKNKR